MVQQHRGEGQGLLRAASLTISSTCWGPPALEMELIEMPSPALQPGSVLLRHADGGCGWVRVPFGLGEMALAEQSLARVPR